MSNPSDPTDQQLDTVVGIFGPDGSRVGTDDDGGRHPSRGHWTSHLEVMATVDGLWAVAVAAYADLDFDGLGSGGPGAETGSYTLDVCIRSIDLDIIKDDDSALDDDQEETPGGFVPLNNDNDDYDFDAGGAPVIDRNDFDGVEGENDFVPLVLRALDVVEEGESYKLVYDETKVLVWDPAYGTQVRSDMTELDPSVETRLLVEGIARSGGAADVEVTLKLVSGGDDQATDKVKLTVYEVTGPTNVPGYSIHTYKGEIPGGGVGSWTATDGTIKTGGNTNTSTILWGEGPFVGKAIFTPAAGFKVEREVNVVQVKIGTTLLDLQISPVQDAADRKLIKSSAGEVAMKAEVTVAAIAGPVIDGTMRGVKFIEMGMIQVGRWASKHGDFDGFTPKKRRLSSLEGYTFYLDTLTGGTLPWADDKSSNDGIAGPDGYFKSATDPAAAITGRVISITDRPQLAGTDTMPLTSGGVTDQVDRFSIVADFLTYFAVHTVEAVNDSEKVYTKRARQYWQFDGSGTVDAAGRWTPTGRESVGSSPFTEITTGEVVPFSTGPTLNSLFATQTWSTVDQ